MGPPDTNPYGSIHGGVIMRHIDEAAAVSAIRHAGKNTVTASIDRLHFIRPVRVGELVTFASSVNMAGTTSMEVGVRVEATNLLTDESRHVASAYLTFVAIDDNGRPARIPPLELETEDDQRRHDEAVTRRDNRLRELAAEK
jgi:uncharacterized protein (TIGR00369 family)